MSAATFNIKTRSGDDYDLVLTVATSNKVPIDLSGRSYRAQIRRNPKASEILGNFEISTTELAAGKLTLSLPRTLTAVLPSESVWDLEETLSNKVRTILAGRILITPDVTR